MNGTLFSAQVGGIRTLKDGSVSITFETPECSPGKAAELFALRKAIAYLYVSANQITKEEQKVTDSLDPELNNKSQSQRIRSVLYLLHQQDNEGYEKFIDYYTAKTERYIEHLKSKLT